MNRQPDNQLVRTSALAAIALHVALLAPVTHAQAISAPTFDPRQPLLDQIGIQPNLGTQVPLDLEFVDSAGKPIRLLDCFAGQPVILHLVYYDCPMLCKLSADGLFRTLSTLSLKPGEDFTIVTLSFDPREGPELSARAREMAAERVGAQAVEGWRFLTGQQPAISALSDSLGFRYAFDEKTKQFVHASGVFVLTPDGRLSRFLTGVEYSPRDLRLALVESGGGQIGAAVDQVMLLCYMYDPITGKYGLAIFTILRAAGVVTVCCLATAIFAMLRRERDRTAAQQASRPGDPAMMNWND